MTTTLRQPNLDTLYCINDDGSRNTIYPADVKGRFQTRKKMVWTVLFAVYLVLPWIMIRGNPAVLIDLPARHFYLFGATFNAQDFYLAFFLITGVGFALIVASAIYGRVWCGYACPQTVFLEGFYRRIERWVEGNRGARQKLSKQNWSWGKVAKRATKWVLFVLLSAFLAHTLLSYFMGVDKVFLAMTQSPTQHPTAFLFVVILTALLTFNFGWFREQLCIVICPYGRLQGVLNDPDTINVAYDHSRGEPRGKITKEGIPDQQGDCIDCQRCVMVCPTGIDIRNGLQLECIGCANCIDACDAVMDKVGRPRGLVRYESDRKIATGQSRFWRPRLLLYAAFMIVGMVVFTVFALGRKPFEANLVRMPTPFVVTETGDVRNMLQLHMINKQPETLTYQIRPVAPGASKTDATLVAESNYVVASPDVKMESFEDRKVTVIVTVPSAEWRTGLQADLKIQVADRPDLVRTVGIRLLGPAR